jgi:nitrate/nitrite-specific signal transduction histidine kinase
LQLTCRITCKLTLANSFALIGTDINLKGALPEAQKVAGVFAEIIRECATNAVRHADASNVYVDIRENDKEHTLLVCNNGVSPSGPIIEGGGIAGIRGKVRELTGVLRIVHRPRFHIHICIPKNRKDDTHEAAPFIFHPADRSVQVRSWP